MIIKYYCHGCKTNIDKNNVKEIYSNHSLNDFQRQHWPIVLKCKICDSDVIEERNKCNICLNNKKYSNNKVQCENCNNYSNYVTTI